MTKLRHIKRRRETAQKNNIRAAQNRSITRRMTALDSASFSVTGHAILISIHGAVLQGEDNRKVVLSV